MYAFIGDWWALGDTAPRLSRGMGNKRLGYYCFCTLYISVWVGWLVQIPWCFRDGFIVLAFYFVFVVYIIIKPLSWPFYHLLQ